MSKSTHSGKTAVIVMVCTLLSRLMGMVRNAVLMTIFGAGQTTDVIISALNVPNNLRKMMAEGALSAAFIPVFTKALTQKDESDKRILNSVIAFQIFAIGAFCALSIIFAKPLITVVLTEFKDPAQIDLAVRLFRWFIGYILLISLSATFMGVLNANDIFVIPALTPLIFSFTVIPSLILFHKTLGPYSLVLGVLTGGFGQVLFQLPKVMKLGYRPRPVIDFNYPDFISVIRRWLPVILTSSVMFINQTVATRFATGLGEGSATALSNAIIFWQVPFGIITASVSTVLFPEMSRKAAKKDWEGLGDSIGYGLRFLLIFLVPSIIAFLLFGKEIIAVVYLGGHFTISDVMKTFYVLSGYTAGLFFAGAFIFLQRPLYSSGKYRITFYISIIICTIDITLSFFLKSTFLGVAGLSISNSISYTFGFFMYVFYISKNVCRIPAKPVFITLLKTIIPGIALILGLISAKLLFGSWWENGRTLLNFCILLGTVIVFAAIVFGLFYVEKESIVQSMFKRRLKKESL